MLKKLALSAVMVIAGVSAVFAQTDDYKKTEVYVGYSNNQVDTGFDSGNTVKSFFRDRENFNGFEASGVYNFNRYVGLKGDVSGAYKSRQVSQEILGVPPVSVTTRFDSSRSVYNFLGGVQIKDNSTEKRFKPFAHALVGAGHARYKAKNVTCSSPGSALCLNPAASFSETGVAAAFGGGIDIKASDKIDIRAIQVDYNPIRLNGGYSHNMRIGVGIVFK